MNQPKTTLICGVIDPRDPGGGCKDSTDWTFSFCLIRWRDSADVLHTSSLRIERHVSEAQLLCYNCRLQALQVRAMRVRFLNETTAELVALFNAEVTNDAELIGYAQEELRPRYFNDAFFGTLILDRRSNCYEGNVPWGSASVRLSLDADENGNLSAIPQSARDLWAQQPTWSERVLQYATEHLLDTKNDFWLEEEEECLTPQQFKSRLHLTAVTIGSSGAFVFCYDDDGLFYGHSISVFGNLTEGPITATLMG